MYNNPYNGFNEDEYLLAVGRRATGYGLLGLLAGLIISLAAGYTKIGTTLLSLLFYYLFLSGYWGAYNINRWFRKYRYRLPSILWQSLRFLVIPAGILLGIIGWGAFEHFILLMALTTQDLGLLKAGIILLPYLGPKYADWINYHPSQPV